MPGVFSCHDSSIVVDGGKVRSVAHIAQKHDWDCGLACVSMMAAYACPGAWATNDHVYDAALRHLNDLFPLTSTTRINGLWTIHLALLLRSCIDTAAARPLRSGATVSQHGSCERSEAEAGSKVDHEGNSISLAMVEGESALLDDDVVEHGNSSAVVQLSFFTTCDGVCASHLENIQFYANTSDAEITAVRDAFVQAPQCGIQLQKLLLSTRDMVDILTGAGVDRNPELRVAGASRRSDPVESSLSSLDSEEILFLCLVNAVQLSCKCRDTWASYVARFTGISRLLPTPFFGHYVVVCGYDKESDKILYRNPGVSDSALCAEAVDTFDHARCCEGTDHDILMLRVVAQ